jgi:hypothetical protein
MSAEVPGVDKLTTEKEWRIIAPEGVDELTALQGELALGSMARALGWSFKEVEKPRETPHDDAELETISRDVFGDPRYGQFAKKFVDWMRYGAQADIICDNNTHFVEFKYSAFHNKFPSFEERLTVDSYANHKEMKRAAMPLIDTMGFPFAHAYVPYDLYGNHVRHHSRRIVRHQASLVPDALSTERLAHFLETPLSKGADAPKDHAMHGTFGRMLDVLCLLAEVKTSVDPSATEAPGEPVPWEEFKEFAVREGVSVNKVYTLRGKITDAAREQLLHGRVAKWGEVILEGNTGLCPSTSMGFREVDIDKVSVSTLANAKGAYTRISPDLADVLSAYEQQDRPTI